jgi:hypothetical protein
MTYKTLTAADKQYLMTSAVTTAKSSTTIQDYIRKASQFSPEKLNQILQFKTNLLEAAKQDAVSAAMVLMCGLQTVLSVEERKDLFLQYNNSEEFEIYMTTHALQNVETAISIFTNHLLGIADLTKRFSFIPMSDIFNAHKNNPTFIRAIVTTNVVDSALPTIMELMYLWRKVEAFNRVLAEDEKLLPRILANIVSAAKYNADSAILVLTCRYAQLLSNTDLLAIYKAQKDNHAFIQYVTTHYLVGGAYLLSRAKLDVEFACEILKTDLTNILSPIAIYNDIYMTHRYNPQFLNFIKNDLASQEMRLPALCIKAPTLNEAVGSSRVMPHIYQLQEGTSKAPSVSKADKVNTSFFSTTTSKPLQSIKAATERVMGSIASQSPRVPKSGR